MIFFPFLNPAPRMMGNRPHFTSEGIRQPDAGKRKNPHPRMDAADYKMGSRKSQKYIKRPITSKICPAKINLNHP